MSTATLTREQRRVVRDICKRVSRDQVVTLGGYAGTGKSTVLRALAEKLPGLAPCAFTGKAANVLRRRGVRDASTIHSLIYTTAATDRGVAFVLKAPAEVRCRGFLVDEASMVSKQLHDDLLSFGLPIVFVGDHGQLPPVGTEVNLMAEPMYRLEVIHRNAGPIARFAEHLRNGHSPWTFERSDQVRVLSPTRLTNELLLGADQVIVAFNKSRVEGNDLVRDLLGRAGVLAEGERVICLRNSRERGLFNGMQGTVVKARLGASPTLDFEAGGELFKSVPYDPTVFGQERPEFGHAHGSPIPFDYAYVVTCHKAQGDEFDDVLVKEERCDKWWDHRRWAYTAASRARRRLFWLAPRPAFPVTVRGKRAADDRPHGHQAFVRRRET